MDSFQFQWPLWYLLLCVIAGLVYAGVLYYKDRTYEDQPSAVTTGMAVLRFVTVTALAALLLAPFVQTYEQSVQDPIVIIAHDNSASIGDALSDQDSIDYRAELDKLRSDLDGKFDVRSIAFGREILEEETLNFDESVTDIGQVLEHVSEVYEGQNLAAVILATDGLYNRGRNPLYQSQRFGAPVYGIALGDTTPQTDLLVQKVLHNRISFLGDRFPVQVDVSAAGLENRKATLQIQRISGGNVTTLKQVQVDIDQENFFATYEFILDADLAGVNRYRARLTGISGETQYSNNIKDFYIEVIDGRLEILVLGSSPHPDLAALKELISSNDNYEVTVALINEFDEPVTDFDMAILHQLPDGKSSIEPLLQAMDNANMPRWFVIGEKTDIRQFNNSQQLMSIVSGGGSANEVTPLVDEDFALFDFPDEFENQLRIFAPVLAPFGEYSVSPSAQVYLYQRIGNVDTRFPLLLYGERDNIKEAVLAAEGLWKWKLFDFLQNGSHELTNTLVNKTVQFVTIKDDKRRFRSSPSRNLYSDEENISFSAELYNQSYELVNDPDVFLVIRDQDGKEYSYTFNKTEGSYALNVGRFPVGEYNYTAFTDYGTQRLTANGKFNIQQIQLESYNTTADHTLLYALADKYAGQVVYPGSLGELSSTLAGDEELRPVIYRSASNEPLLNLRWLFFVFLLLLGLEWFMRRYFGGY